MRESIAAMALIRQDHEGRTLWLAQWNSPWGRYHLVGGHKRDNESFRECVIREVQEELGIAAGTEFTVGEASLTHLDYRDWSERAAQETRYVVELFEVQLAGKTAYRKVAADRRNRWVAEGEIRDHRCRDGMPISVTMERLLGLAGLLEIPCPGPATASTRTSEK
jgi:8-oxo-dGTP pyrophosphatase MutT (NUDIX family)